MLVLGACTKYKYRAEAADPTLNLAALEQRTFSQQEFLDFLTYLEVPKADWPPLSWSVNDLARTSFFFNPDVQVLAAEFEIINADLEIAAQRANPVVELPFSLQLDNLDSPWLIGVVTNFLFERRDKRQARIDAARAYRNSYLVKLETHLWKTYNALHKEVVSYRNASLQSKLLATQVQLMQQAYQLLEKRQQLGQVSEFELNRQQLELRQLELQQASQAYRLNNARHRLIRRTGLQADKFSEQEFQLELKGLALPAYGEDEDYARSVLTSNHYSLREALANYNALEAELRLEIQKQYPDINLVNGFVRDQSENVWSLAASWVMPVFHNNEAQIERALAERERQQRKILAIQSGLLSELARLQLNYREAKQAHSGAKMLLADLEKRDKTLSRQFELGYIDRLALYTSKIELVKARMAVLGVETDLLQSIVLLEDLLQDPVTPGIDFRRVLQYLTRTEVKKDHT